MTGLTENMCLVQGKPYYSKEKYNNKQTLSYISNTIQALGFVDVYEKVNYSMTVSDILLCHVD